jgi:hypothetical protein
MTTRSLFASAFAFLLLCSNAFPAAPDLSGKWKWKLQRNGEDREIVMTAKQEGSKLTGKIAGPEGRETDIRDGKVSEDGKITFYINFERDGNSIKVDFKGKAEEDKISGKTEYEVDGEKRERDWVATREAAKGRAVTGTWKSSFKRQDGSSMDSTLTLKQDGQKLTGSNEFNGSESEIQDGKVQGEEVSFNIFRERDGRKVTSKYHGKIQPDNSIKGQIESDWTGEVRKLEWEAKKQ